jgi:hypothetical protein
MTAQRGNQGSWRPANQQLRRLEPLVLVRLAQQPGDLDEPG